VNVPPGEYEIAIDTGALRRFAEDAPLLLFLDGHRVPPLPGTDSSGLARFAVRREMFREPSVQQIVLACSPLSTGHGPERRRLGVPVFELAFRPAPTSLRRNRARSFGDRRPS